VISVVIPTYNERDNIKKLIPIISSLPIDVEMVVVDDSSPDGTSEVVKDFIRRGYNVKLLQRDRKMGLATAVIDGAKIAKYDYVAVMDADLQHPPELLIEMAKYIRDYDIVIASRYVSGGGCDFGLVRKVVSRTATAIAHTLIPKIRGVKDPLSGYFLIRREILTENNHYTTKGFKILLEILSKGNYRVKEVPFTIRSRSSGKSKLGIREVTEFLKTVFRASIETGEIFRVLRYLLVGIMGILICTAVLWLFTDVLGLFYMVSAIIAYEVSIISNFLMNDVWSFGDLVGGKGGRFYRLLKYNITRVGGILLSLFVLFVLTSVFNIYYLLSNVIAIVVGFMYGYTTCLHIVWRG